MILALLLAAALAALLVAALQDETEGALPRYLHRRQYHGRHTYGYTPPAVVAAPVLSALEAPETSPSAKAA
jgi:hypothetical protein